MVASKWPGMPRMPSWVAALAPSRLIDTAFTPLPAMSSSRSLASGVTDGDSATGTPSDVA